MEGIAGKIGEILWLLEPVRSGRLRVLFDDDSEIAVSRGHPGALLSANQSSKIPNSGGAQSSALPTWLHDPEGQVPFDANALALSGA